MLPVVNRVLSGWLPLGQHKTSGLAPAKRLMLVAWVESDVEDFGLFFMGAGRSQFFCVYLQNSVE